MLKKFQLAPALAAIAALGLLPACLPEDEEDTTLLRLGGFLLLETSGNCVQLSRSSSTLYSATGNTVPRAGCNFATLFPIVTTSAEAKAGSDAGVDAAIALAATAGCDSSVATGLDSYKNSITAASLESAAGALTLNCATLANGSIFCPDSGAAILEVSRFVVTGSVQGDMAASFAGNITQQSASASMASTGWSADAINNMRLATSGELATLRPLGTARAALSAAAAGSFITSSAATACSQSVLQTQRELTLAVTSFSGGSGVTGNAADGATVTQVILPSVSCGYGSDFTDIDGSPFRSCGVPYAQF